MSGNVSRTRTKTQYKPIPKEQRKIYNERSKAKRIKKKSDQLLNDPKLEETKDYLVCKVCNHACQDMALHLKNHDMNMAQYREQYDENAIVKPTNRTDRMKGENNPAYGHGGKYSPFSKKFVKGDISESTVKKSISNRTLRGNDTTTIGYYVKQGYTEEEAKVKLSERQSTFNLEKCIEKYGEVEGRKRWQDRQDKWQNTLNAKSDEEKAIINRKKVSSGHNISKAEFEILDYLKGEGIVLDTQHNILNEDSDNQKGYLYDFRKGNKIIEYHGNYWHLNPSMYSADYWNQRLKMTAKEKWAKDQEKIDYATSLGYEVMIVWESEYKKDKKKTLEKCKNFFQNK